jgi:hypothetical protein
MAIAWLDDRDYTLRNSGYERSNSSGKSPGAQCMSLARIKRWLNRLFIGDEMAEFLGKSAAIWYKSDIAGGDDQKIGDRAVNWGQGFILPKIGNGVTKWQGLQGLVERTHERGLKFIGWWYVYGQAEEGRVMGEHARDLGVDGVVIDWESHADNAFQDDPTIAQRIIGDLKNEAPDTPVGLSSWWKPSLHQPDALNEILDHCEWNMPQCYAIGDWTNEASANRIVSAIDEYEALSGFGADRTVPGIAAFGQHFGADNTWWETTVEQMKQGEAKAKELECPGIWVWSWNYMIGKSGNLDGQRREEFIDEVKSWDWAVPTPPPSIEECEEELAACQAALAELEARFNAKENQLEESEARRAELENWRIIVLSEMSEIEGRLAEISQSDPGAAEIE